MVDVSEYIASNVCKDLSNETIELNYGDAAGGRRMSEFKIFEKVRHLRVPHISDIIDISAAAAGDGNIFVLHHDISASNLRVQDARLTEFKATDWLAAFESDKHK
ncbi:hypothetical protein EV178_002013 [Coemansia sp. RSA 1646]|nr:hypothetical protein EV178_002013 [Coemansia sp. RSA 1646]